jgi:hypothetical protein
MTKQQIEALIKTHTARLDRAIAILNQNYYEFEDDDNQANYQFWIGEFKKENQILDWLKSQMFDAD